MQRQLLILDIDETLVYATETPLERPPDFRAGPFVAYHRPHLHKFIEAVLGWFDVAVWSSSTADYAAIVTANVFCTSAAPKFVWARDRCTRRFNPETWQEDWIKSVENVRTVEKRKWRTFGRTKPM